MPLASAASASATTAARIPTSATGPATTTPRPTATTPAHALAPPFALVAVSIREIDGVHDRVGALGGLVSAAAADTVVYSIYFADTHRDEGERRGEGMGRSGGGWPGGGGGWPGGGGGYPGGGGGRGGRSGGQRHPEEPRTDGKKILERVSKETGGRFFEVSKKQTVGEIYTSIVEELRTQYSMGYTPDKDSAASGYHHLQLQVKRKELTVQTRDGYYADR